MIFFLKKFQSSRKNIFNLLNINENKDSHSFNFFKKKNYYNYLNYFSFFKNKSFYFFKKQLNFDFSPHIFDEFTFINIFRFYLSFFFFNLYTDFLSVFQNKFKSFFFPSSWSHIYFFNFLIFLKKKNINLPINSLINYKQTSKINLSKRNLLLSNIFFFPNFKEFSDSFSSYTKHIKNKKRYTDFFTYFKIYSLKDNSNFDNFQETLPLRDIFLTPIFYSKKKFTYFKNFNKLNFFFFLKHKKTYLTIKNLNLFIKNTDDAESTEDLKVIDRKDKKINKLFLNFLNLFYFKNINLYFLNKKKYSQNFFFLLFFKDFYLKTKLKLLSSFLTTFSKKNARSFYLCNKNISIFSYKNENILKKFNLFSIFNHDLFFFFQKPIFLKTFILKTLGSNNDSSYFSNCFAFLKKFPLTSKFNNILNNSLLPFDIVRQALHNFSMDRFQSYYAYLPHIALLNFLEYCTGRKILIKIDPFVLKSISEEDKYRCFVWSRRLRSFRKNLGPRLFLNESLQIITLCLRLKDPYVLSDWMLSMFYKISFWKYKMLFRYMQYILRNFFWAYFIDYGVKGLKFQLKGKVSVAGNGRKRTVVMRVGALSHGTYKYKVLTHLNLLRTFTGVIGFRTWFVF